MLMTVKIRRDKGWQVKPEAETIDGKTFDFRVGWNITEKDSGIYAGEKAMLPTGKEGKYPLDAPAWIASGDLVEAH